MCENNETLSGKMCFESDLQISFLDKLPNVDILDNNFASYINWYIGDLRGGGGWFHALTRKCQQVLFLLFFFLMIGGGGGVGSIRLITLCFKLSIERIEAHKSKLILLTKKRGLVALNCNPYWAAHHFVEQLNTLNWN